MIKPQIIAEQIHLEQIHILSANFETDKQYRDQPVKPHVIQFAFGKDIAHNMEFGRSRIRLSIIMTGLKEEELPLGLELKYELEFHFKVDNFNDFVHSTKDESVQLDTVYGTTLLGIAFSTARGIIYERTRGTFMDGVLMPVIDPTKLLMEEEKNKLKTEGGLKG